MKNVMIKAWEIAREGATKFGGKACEYFIQALKMAWAIVNKGVKKMEEFVMNGSEKQVAWAMNIRVRSMRFLNSSLEMVRVELNRIKGEFPIEVEEDREAVEYMEKEFEAILNNSSAKFHIDNFKDSKMARHVIGRLVDMIKNNEELPENFNFMAEELKATANRI